MQPAERSANVNANRPPNARTDNYDHATEVWSHQYAATSRGNPATDEKYQQQPDTLAAKQNQEHEKLQQQHEKEHQQIVQENTSDTQKQQMERRNSQQTQQLEQKRARQQQEIETHHQPHQSVPQSRLPAPKP